jgi:hypothetical protein
MWLLPSPRICFPVSEERNRNENRHDAAIAPMITGAMTEDLTRKTASTTNPSNPTIAPDNTVAKTHGQIAPFIPMSPVELKPAIFFPLSMVPFGKE